MMDNAVPGVPEDSSRLAGNLRFRHVRRCRLFDFADSKDRHCSVEADLSEFNI
jgi:hypothetical protein